MSSISNFPRGRPSGNWLTRIFPPITSRTIVGHYIPVSGAISHTLFSIHIFNPAIVTKYFPVGELAVSNTILFNANIGIGFYIFFRQHMSKLSSWQRVEFSVFASTMFNFGSLLTAVLVKALLPTKTAAWIKTVLATSLSFLLLRTGKKYLKYIDLRSASSRRTSPIRNNLTVQQPTYPHLLQTGDNGFIQIPPKSVTEIST
ncbi:unnamed protein product, partial [Mesorhabditis belari]|uniref:GtrA-like protein domain-containing protein n=1 Tax=Mesorhabditis belari TaxID=2138241 RepID=A0AAF3FI02_9BILA